MYLFLQNADDYSKIISTEPSGVLTAGSNPHDAWQLFSNVTLNPRYPGFPEASDGHFSTYAFLQLQKLRGF
jgi:hypothetical protein